VLPRRPLDKHNFQSPLDVNGLSSRSGALGHDLALAVSERVEPDRSPERSPSPRLRAGGLLGSVVKRKKYRVHWASGPTTDPHSAAGLWRYRAGRRCAGGGAGRSRSRRDAVRCPRFGDRGCPRDRTARRSTCATARRSLRHPLVGRIEGRASRYLGFQLAGAKRCSAATRLTFGPSAVRSHSSLLDHRLRGDPDLTHALHHERGGPGGLSSLGHRCAN
jgi:hypothetical protein